MGNVINWFTIYQQAPSSMGKKKREEGDTAFVEYS
jgi:hypothetical protein